MLICGYCKTIFEEPDSEYYRCPECGCEDVDIAEKCPICGDYYDGETECCANCIKW